MQKFESVQPGLEERECQDGERRVETHNVIVLWLHLWGMKVEMSLNLNS